MTKKHYFSLILILLVASSFPYVFGKWKTSYHLDQFDRPEKPHVSDRGKAEWAESVSKEELVNLILLQAENEEASLKLDRIIHKDLRKVIAILFIANILLIGLVAWFGVSTFKKQERGKTERD